MDPTVSVLVPTYNHHEFIAESLDSIIKQDYKNLEIIVSDDASTDGAQDILSEYARKYPDKVTVLLADSRGGVSRNCNRAWSKCNGKYLSLMSGDDIMLPGKIRRQVELMESEAGCVISYHDLDVFDSQTRRTMYQWNDLSQHKPRENGVRDIIIFGTFIGACSSMLRRSACPDAGFDEAIPVASDWLFLIESAARGGSIRFIPEVLGGHRRHANNITNRNLGLDEQFRTLEIIESRYPHLHTPVQKGRGRLYYAQAVESLNDRRSGDARHAIYSSFRHGWYSWKLTARLLQSLVNR